MSKDYKRLYKKAKKHHHNLERLVRLQRNNMVKMSQNIITLNEQLNEQLKADINREVPNEG